MKTVRIRIDGYEERQNVVWALVGAGYTVREMDVHDTYIPTISAHYILFTVDEEDIFEV